MSVKPKGLLPITNNKPLLETVKPSETEFWRRYQAAVRRKQYEVHMPLSAIAEFVRALQGAK